MGLLQLIVGMCDEIDQQKTQQNRQIARYCPHYVRHIDLGTQVYHEPRDTQQSSNAETDHTA